MLGLMLIHVSKKKGAVYADTVWRGQTIMLM